jgi:hypothetical protein
MNKDKAKVREILNKKPQIYAYIPLYYIRTDECTHRIKTELKAYIINNTADLVPSGTDRPQGEVLQITTIRMNGRSVDFSISFNIKDYITEDIFIYITNKIKRFFTGLRELTETATDISVFYKENGVLKYKVLKTISPILEGSGRKPQFIPDE